LSIGWGQWGFFSHQRFFSNWDLCSNWNFPYKGGLSQTSLVKFSTNKNLVIWCERRNGATRISVSIEDGEGPLKGGEGSVRMKPGGECPEEVGPLGVLDGVCVEVKIEAFNARYPGGSVGVTLGESGVPMGV
jgi:hypothetical protein